MRPGQSRRCGPDRAGAVGVAGGSSAFGVDDLRAAGSSLLQPAGDPLHAQHPGRTLLERACHGSKGAGPRHPLAPLPRHALGRRRRRAARRDRTQCGGRLLGLTWLQQPSRGPSERAGLMEAPLIGLAQRPAVATIRAGATTEAARPMWPCVAAPTTAAPAPASTSRNVPNISLNNRRHSKLRSVKSRAHTGSRSKRGAAAGPCRLATTAATRSRSTCAASASPVDTRRIGGTSLSRGLAPIFTPSERVGRQGGMEPACSRSGGS